MIMLFSTFTDYPEETIAIQPTTPSTDNNLSTILPLVFTIVLIILVCVVVFVLWRRRRRINEFDRISESGFTMRDKLRAESLKSLDTLLLRHFDPNKLRQYRLDRVQYVGDLGMGSFGKVFQGKLHLSYPFPFSKSSLSSLSSLPNGFLPLLIIAIVTQGVSRGNTQVRVLCNGPVNASGKHEEKFT